MATLSDASIANYAKKAGFVGSGLVTAIAVALAESGGVTNAVNYNKNRAGQVLSIDRGLWQINSVYHPEVSDSCAFDPSCSARSAYSISKNGTAWQPWSTYTNGQYKAFISRASTAAGTYVMPSTAPPPIPDIAPPDTKSAQMKYILQSDTSGIKESVRAATNADVEDPNGPSYTQLGSGDLMNPLRIMLAWGIMFAIFFVLAKTRLGYAALYYAEVLVLLFLFATQSQFFKEALSPLTQVTQPKAS